MNLDDDLTLRNSTLPAAQRRDAHRDQILKDLAAGTITLSEASVRLDEIQIKQPAELHCRIAEKGGVSVYRLGRWPVTLYGAQWLKLAEFMPKLLEFIEENRERLAWRDHEG